MIEKIYIEGFKSIKKQSIELEDINIFIGGNGVGKSNFISVFSLIKALYDSRLSEYVIKKGGVDNLLYFGKKNTEEIHVNILFQENDDRNKFIATLGYSKDNLFIKSIDTEFYKELWHSQNHEKNIKESNFRNIRSGQAYWVNDRLKEFEVYHFHDTGESSPMKNHSEISDNKALRKNGANIAAFLYFLKKKYHKNYLRIEKTITSVAPFFNNFILEPNPLNERLIKIEWQEKGMADSYFDAHNLSDGTLRFICLTTLLMQPNPPKTIIIDEPELGLHPVAINKIASLMRKVSKKSQLIVSTQSLNFVDNFEPVDIVVTNRENSETVFERLKNEDLQEWLRDYSLGDIWGKNIIGGQPFN